MLSIGWKNILIQKMFSFSSKIPLSIIKALSQKEEFPGVDVKYWMQNTTFEKVDELLKANGNDRTVEVRSDIVLCFPNKIRFLLKQEERFKVFTSTVKGIIVDKEIEFTTQPFYSWLDNKTFNKWFVPEGCKTVISLLPIHKAQKYDFRLGSFQQMLNFLENFNLIKKIPSDDNAVKDLNKEIVQRNLFMSPHLFIVCGYTCAGKTTLAGYITDKYNYYHFEASDYMYLSYYQNHGVNSAVSIGDFAEKALEDYPSIVVDQIINDIYELGNIPIIITGFRSPKEVESFVHQYRGDSKIEVIFIDTKQELRYQRCFERSRFDKHKGHGDFKSNDEQQNRMGLEKIMDSLVDVKIYNNGTFEEYYNTFETKFSDNLQITKNSFIQNIDFSERSLGLEVEIVLCLHKEFHTEKYFTTTEISKLVNYYFHNGDSVEEKE